MFVVFFAGFIFSFTYFTMSKVCSCCKDTAGDM